MPDLVLIQSFGIGIKKACLKQEPDAVPTLFIKPTITMKRICDIDNPPPKKRRSAYEKCEQYKVSLTC